MFWKGLFHMVYACVHACDLTVKICLSSSQGYEGSLIKLTSKQVRGFQPMSECSHATLTHHWAVVDVQGINNPQFRPWGNIFCLEHFSNIVFTSWLCVSICFNPSVFCLPARWVCNLWQSVWSWSCKKCIKCKSQQSAQLEGLHYWCRFLGWGFAAPFVAFLWNVT